MVYRSALTRWLNQQGYRTPLDRVFRRERPKCGAKCRDGHPCQAPALFEPAYGCYIRNGRCRLHGGLSTGPRTAAGKRRIAAAARKRMKAYHKQRRQQAAQATG